MEISKRLESNFNVKSLSDSESVVDLYINESPKPKRFRNSK